MNEYNCLKLENQLCFPLYACSKEIIKRYKPYLNEIDLTYTQYIVMMVLWEKEEINIKTLGERLYLDSGTLTPLLKKLETKGYIKRDRLETDERNLNLVITEKGKKLKDKAKDIPGKIVPCINLTEQETLNLYQMLYKILGKK